jgi:hypothetical protein
MSGLQVNFRRTLSYWQPPEGITCGAKWEIPSHAMKMI